jgi:hypothetical protein
MNNPPGNVIISLKNRANASMASRTRLNIIVGYGRYQEIRQKIKGIPGIP